MISLTGQPGVPENSFMLAGELFDMGHKCVKWFEPGGYDGYTKVPSKVTEIDLKTGRERIRVIKGPRYSRRRMLGNQVDAITQLLVHHSGADRTDPSTMWDVLYNQRGLSVHFCTEDDGRLWQFNDLVDACWHAGSHNKIAVGDECCLYPDAVKRPRYYDETNRRLTGNLPHEIVVDTIHGREMKVFAFTTEQCESLARLYAGVWVAVGLMRTKGFEPGTPFSASPQFYRDGRGMIPVTTIPNPTKHIGLIGHLQCTRNKVDPSGFPWERFERRVETYYWEFRGKVDKK